ncbi:hypothetical protein [Arthrobacter sp. SLBN-100]|uniref:hypothetical protein n=1 Tax=Arthrobacter sp. SLBN-100 TaxID=2768450 RepID=UPI001F2D5C72
MPSILDHRAALRQHGIQRHGEGARVQPAVRGVVGAWVVGRSFGQPLAGFRAPGIRRRLTLQQLEQTPRGGLDLHQQRPVHG